MKNNNESSCRAKARWKLLSQALKPHKESDVNNEVYSVRRFSGYDLFHTERVYEDVSDDCTWFQYSLNKFIESKPIKIRLLQNITSADELIGFNNTGNICVWPSEEVLAYYCLRYKPMFSNKTICELGCGMTGLAGMLVAGNTECSKVLLTDGNQVSVDNMNLIIKANNLCFDGKTVQSSLLRWGENFEGNNDEYDVVLCADCLFFVDMQNCLIETIKQIMRKDGVCIILAPQRSGTLDKFVESAKKTFVVHLDDRYDDHIWNLHEISCSNKLYCTDLHFPMLIKLWHKQNV